MLKQINKTNKYFVIVLLFFVTHINTFSQGIYMSGPSKISLETNTSFSTVELDPANYGHVQYTGISTSDPSNILILNNLVGNGINAGSFDIFIKRTYTYCAFNITLYLRYNDSSGNPIGTGTEVKSITILPSIIIPSIFYPGENTNLNIQNNCSYSGCDYLWNVSPASVCPTCGPTGSSTQAIYIDPSDVPGSINVNCTMSNCSPALPSTALQGVWAPVKLRNPMITGPQSIGCAGSPPIGNFQYNAGFQYGATYFVWNVPSFLTIVSGQGTANLTVIENALGSGNITLQTYNGSGSLVYSNIVSYPVQVCCRSSFNITSDVNSPNTDSKESSISLNASNVINNGASAMYHAGTEVQLSPGFSALQGSYFHAYVEGCTGNYNRMINPEDNNDPKNNSEIAQIITDTKIDESSVIDKLSNNEINVYPNPNSGEFTLTLNHNDQLPESISIRDAYGKEIKTIFNPKDYKYNFDLKNYDSGLYIINLFYSDKTMSKRIVKN